MAKPRGLWHLSSPSRDWTLALSSERARCQPLDCQGIPMNILKIIELYALRIHFSVCELYLNKKQCFARLIIKLCSTCAQCKWYMWEMTLRHIYLLQEEKETAEDEMVEWLHWFSGHVWAHKIVRQWRTGKPEACFSPCSHKELDMTEQLSSNKFIAIFWSPLFCYITFPIWGIP